MNNEQQEAKLIDFFSLFTNVMMDVIKDLQSAIKDKTGQEYEDAIHACLLDCLAGANLIGKDESLISQGSPFTNNETKSIVTQAILFVGSKYGPIKSTEMESLLDCATTCVKGLKKEYHKKGIHHQIAPHFHVIMADDGKPRLVLIDKNKLNNDDYTSTSPIN